MDWYRMWARRTRCLTRLDVVAVGREKIGKDGHLRVVTETWAHQVKNLSRLQRNYKQRYRKMKDIRRGVKIQEPRPQS